MRAALAPQLLVASLALLAVAAHSTLPACGRDRVSLGDDRIAAPDATVAPPPSEPAPDAATPPPDAATPPSQPDPQPQLSDAGWRGGFFDGPFAPDARAPEPDQLDCGFCAPGELCVRVDDPSCGAVATRARCQRIEEVCPQNDGPVCGCDGTSYPTRCEAVALGATVRAPGTCGSMITPCAAFAGASCGPNAYCRFALGAYCGASGVLGSCEPEPEACDDDGRAVCGCDRQSYENACLAAMAGVSIGFLGSCESGGGGGGGGPSQPPRSP